MPIHESMKRDSESASHIWVGLLSALVLAFWLRQDNLWLASAALLLSGTATALAIMSGRSFVSGVILFLAASVSVWSSMQDGRIENRWDDVREESLDQIAADLARRMALIQRELNSLLDLGESVLTLPREDGFTTLGQALRSIESEAGVIVYSPGGLADKWAGTFSVRPESYGSQYRFRRTAFHSVLEYERQLDSGIVIAQVLLQSTAPVIGGHKGALDLGQQTAVTVGPPSQFDAGDAFDYCVPDCNAVDADTVFSVAVELSSQSEVKARSLQRGGAASSVLLLVGLLVTGFLATGLARAVSIVGIPLVLVLTDAGVLLGGESLFSPATYFAPHLGIFSSSAGALGVSSAGALLLVAYLWRFKIPRSPLSFAASMVILAGAPYSLRILARGITPPATGTGPALWVGWQVGVFLASVIFVLVSAILIRGERQSPVWVSVSAAAWALIAATVGLFLWAPGPGTAWPDWYTFLWFPALILAVQPAPKARLLITAAIVSGSAAALLTWGASIEGRIVLARQDAENLKEGTDLLALSVLERFGADMAAMDQPSTPADLLRLWREGELQQEHYPARLNSLGAEGDTIARLDLADFDVDGSVVSRLVADSRETGQPQIVDYLAQPGHHLVLAVPHDGGSTVVAVAPDTRLVRRTVVGGLVNGAEGSGSPYDIVLSDVVDRDEPDFLRWRREGSRVRGETTIEVPAGRRHLHLNVPLRPVMAEMVRGGLVVILNVILLMALWSLGEFAIGVFELPERARRWVRLRGYTAAW